MKPEIPGAKLRNFFQIVGFVLFALLLIRLFPVVFSLVARAGVAAMSLWGAVLVVALLGWLVWVFRKRNAG